MIELDSKKGFISTPEGKIECEIVGMGRKGIPLLLVNGGPCGNRNTMMGVMGRIVEDRPVISYSQMNAPGSQPLSRTDSSYWTLEYYTEEIERVRSAFGLKKMVIFGHSWGGGLAINYASKYPQFCTGIIAGSPLISVRDWTRDTKARLRQIEPSVKQFINTVISSIANVDQRTRQEIEESAMEALFIACFQDACFAPELCLNYLLGQKKSDWVPEGKEVYRHMWGKNEYTITGTLKNMDISRILPKLSVPVFFLVGENDEILPETVEGYAEKTKKSDLYVIGGASHSFIKEVSPREYSQIRSRIQDLFVDFSNFQEAVI